VSPPVDFISGEGVIWPRAIRNWTRHFTDGDQGPEDQTKISRSCSTKYMQAIRELLANGPYLSPERIASILAIRQGNVRRILQRELVHWITNLKWIPQCWIAFKNCKGIDSQRSYWGSLSENRQLTCHSCSAINM
jgi:hypothetical protein